jgi:hypothetical protein
LPTLLPISRVLKPSSTASSALHRMGGPNLKSDCPEDTAATTLRGHSSDLQSQDRQERH